VDGMTATRIQHSSDARPGAELSWSESLPEHSDVLRRELAERGYAVVRSVFTKVEIERLRTIVRGHLQRSGSRFSLGKTQPNAAIAVPDLGFVFSHSRVVRLFKSLIVNGPTVFTGHCDIHMNMLSGWHRDSGEAYGGYFSGDYMADETCRVFKMAIYLQDTTPRDGLSVVPGSHRQRTYDINEAVPLCTSQGDAVIFDVRLAHVGQLPDWLEKGIKALNILLKGRNRTVEDSSIATKLKSVYWRLVGRRDRLSVFFTYGEDNERTHEFAKANMVRQTLQTAVAETRLSGSLVEELSRQGVTIAPL
jgi:hypothetical protein